MATWRNNRWSQLWSTCSIPLQCSYNSFPTNYQQMGMMSRRIILCNCSWDACSTCRGRSVNHNWIPRRLFIGRWLWWLVVGGDACAAMNGWWRGVGGWRSQWMQNELHVSRRNGWIMMMWVWWTDELTFFIALIRTNHSPPKQPTSSSIPL